MSQSQPLFITGVLPHFRQPSLLANTLALWQAQTHPAERRALIILDDGGTFWNQSQADFTLWSAAQRLPSLPAKYNRLLELIPPQTEAVAIVETNGVYAPNYLELHARALEQAEFSKPSTVFSDYELPARGELVREHAAGRFHSSMAFRVDLIKRIGGWPDTKRADFDQQLIAKLLTFTRGHGNPCEFGDRFYCYSWHTGHAHCQSTMRSPGDEEWYARGEQAYAQVAPIGELKPKLDERTKKILGMMGVAVPDELSQTTRTAAEPQAAEAARPL